ncbi:hypothetical protein QL285_045852 [Trifolium repens]|jgi:hypothetical protein|nr:hypothetical protein QL285_045852 [Trifolium repens]
MAFHLNLPTMSLLLLHDSATKRNQKIQQHQQHGIQCFHSFINKTKSNHYISNIVQQHGIQKKIFLEQCFHSFHQHETKKKEDINSMFSFLHQQNEIKKSNNINNMEL